jgi:hypothetical protein
MIKDSANRLLAEENMVNLKKVRHKNFLNSKQEIAVEAPVRFFLTFVLSKLAACTTL